MSIESYIEREFPLASDTSKRRARRAFRTLRDLSRQSIQAFALPRTAEHYEHTLDALKRSHTANHNKIADLAFATGRAKWSL
jgi:hypothetical protein